jgi:hypothetical protein
MKLQNTSITDYVSLVSEVKCKDRFSSDFSYGIKTFEKKVDPSLIIFSVVFDGMDRKKQWSNLRKGTATVSDWFKAAKQGFSSSRAWIVNHEGLKGTIANGMSLVSKEKVRAVISLVAEKLKVIMSSDTVKRSISDVKTMVGKVQSIVMENYQKRVMK